MRAITVMVDYSDYGAITLPRMRHHFTDCMIVTTPEDVAAQDLADEYHCQKFTTNAFYDGGAHFNKWKALELGLDQFGREDWMCILDCDVIWPWSVRLDLEVGCLYTPFRRMMTDMSQPIPHESLWNKFPRHWVVSDFSGYTQIFHASDPVLPIGNYHETDWKHAGGADTAFQNRWPASRKIRPSWECLHLGTPGTNWCGRATNYLDGTRPVEADSRIATLQGYMRSRRLGAGFGPEKIRDTSSDH